MNAMSVSAGESGVSLVPIPSRAKGYRKTVEWQVMIVCLCDVANAPPGIDWPRSRAPPPPYIVEAKPATTKSTTHFFYVWRGNKTLCYDYVALLCRCGDLVFRSTLIKHGVACIEHLLPDKEYATLLSGKPRDIRNAPITDDGFNDACEVSRILRAKQLKHSSRKAKRFTRDDSFRWGPVSFLYKGGRTGTFFSAVRVPTEVPHQVQLREAANLVLIHDFIHHGG